jgi:hypothetical protein
MKELEHQISNNQQKIRKIKQSKESFEDEMQDYVNMSSYDFTHNKIPKKEQFKTEERLLENISSSINRENWEMRNMKECLEELQVNLLQRSPCHSRTPNKSNKTVDTNVFKGLKDFMNRLRSKIEEVSEDNIKLNKKEILDLISLKMESLMVSESNAESQISVSKNNLIESNIEDFISIYKYHQHSEQVLQSNQNSEVPNQSKLVENISSNFQNNPPVSNFLKKHKRELQQKKKELPKGNITSINVTQHNSSIKNNQTSYKRPKMLYKTEDSIYNQGLESLNNDSDQNNSQREESHDKMIKVEGLSLKQSNKVSKRYLDLEHNPLLEGKSVLSLNYANSKQSLTDEKGSSFKADEATTANKTNISAVVRETKSKLLSSTKVNPNESELGPNTNIKNIELNLLNSKTFIQSNQHLKQSTDLLENKKNRVPNNTKGNSLNSSIKRVKVRERSHPISNLPYLPKSSGSTDYGNFTLNSEKARSLLNQKDSREKRMNEIENQKQKKTFLKNLFEKARKCLVIANCQNRTRTSLIRRLFWQAVISIPFLAKLIRALLITKL